MLSYRAQLAKLGYGPAETVSYRSFFLAPASLRKTMRSMDFPTSFWEADPGDEWDEDWTEEVQGCAFAFNRWFFVSNRAGKPRLHVFDGSMNKVASWDLAAVPPPDPELPGFEFYHFGAVLIEGNRIYIDHWCDAPERHGQILVLEGDGSYVNFVRWITLQDQNGRVGMIALNVPRRRIVTAGGEKNIAQVYLHDLDSGDYAGKTLALNPPITDGAYAQGGFWSPNNHLYISSGIGGLDMSSRAHQWIYCYSPLNGRLMGTVHVTTQWGKQELEGCSYADVIRNGQHVYFHAVLLENEEGSADDIYLKSFSADRPELI
jgi:hypothetical protein